MKKLNLCAKTYVLAVSVTAALVVLSQSPFIGIDIGFKMKAH